MTHIQIIALIGLILTVALLYWAGYLIGRSNGREAGIEEGKAFAEADNARALRELTTALKFMRADNQRLAELHERLQDSQTLKPAHRKSLLAIADLLRIAADTFSAFKTGKKLERDSRSLRDQALAMAALVEPAAQEKAA
ncbi:MULTISPECIES: hypothetical protein [unclassified Pseudomonas]|uniref:hypothetical protein n=1 Tax=unclassified Pseudomonas TaxID=196821 RepID=UPI000875F11E|nr:MULTISPECIES: hypothetical protein [unclassified Pseudomonas]SCZ75946.1 hypothetical protein SAMN03159460_06249 [Pseudomonas sp. NFPP17]SDA90073.1 hypothetical protein SAMN03159464_06253 [Pseudomonas sp. NFPP15]SEL72302.1 hypothetical protein SAMN03159324_05053 [Pseudomonas sp. NFPP18]SFA66337.1 hypothetical protein SAMN03159320_04871 [Pseudomonas sp. NFPP13]SFU05061.1 hypothetical protein SAMN03159492_05054 [Pseudomonas sp. NFPP25]